MSRRLSGLCVIAAALLLAWLEFGTTSPLHRSIRTACDNYRLETLRADWRPPCQSETWSYPEFEGASIPVPACLEYEVVPSLDLLEEVAQVHGGIAGVLLMALDRESADTRLLISIRTREDDQINRTYFEGRGDSCSISRDDDVFLATCFGTHHVIVGDKYFSTWWDMPWYVEEKERDRQEAVLTRIVDEFVRLRSGRAL